MVYFVGSNEPAPGNRKLVQMGTQMETSMEYTPKSLPLAVDRITDACSPQRRDADSKVTLKLRFGLRAGWMFLRGPDESGGRMGHLLCSLLPGVELFSNFGRSGSTRLGDPDQFMGECVILGSSRIVFEPAPNVVVYGFAVGDSGDGCRGFRGIPLCHGAAPPGGRCGLRETQIKTYERG
jgi:hypothetical protein